MLWEYIVCVIQSFFTKMLLAEIIKNLGTDAPHFSKFSHKHLKAMKQCVDPHHTQTHTHTSTHTLKWSMTPPDKYQLLKSLLWYWTNHFFLEACFIREEKSVQHRNSIVIGYPCVRIYIKINSPFGRLWSKSGRVTIFLSANLGVFALSETLDKEGKEMTAGNNKNSIQKTSNKKEKEKMDSYFFIHLEPLMGPQMLRSKSAGTEYHSPVLMTGWTWPSAKTLPSNNTQHTLHRGKHHICSHPTFTPLR